MIWIIRFLWLVAYSAIIGGAGFIHPGAGVLAAGWCVLSFANNLNTQNTLRLRALASAAPLPGQSAEELATLALLGRAARRARRKKRNTQRKLH